MLGLSSLLVGYLTFFPFVQNPIIVPFFFSKFFRWVGKSVGKQPVGAFGTMLNACLT